MFPPGPVMSGFKVRSEAVPHALKDEISPGVSVLSKYSAWSVHVSVAPPPEIRLDRVAPSAAVMVTTGIVIAGSAAVGAATVGFTRPATLL